MTAAFLTPLEVRLVHDTANEGRGEWMVIAPLVFRSVVAGLTFTVPPGQMTDFGSVKRLPLVFLAYGDRGHRATVLHDYFYRQKVKEVNRRLADDIFKEALLATGVDQETAEQMYFGVRFGGQAYWDADIGAIGFSVEEAGQHPLL